MLGLRIAALRREQGLSQAQLAQRLKISASTVGMYEQGRREPSAQTLVSIARELQVSTDFLLTGQVANQQEEDELYQLLINRAISARQHLLPRGDRPFTRQELAVFLAALLTEP